MSTETQPHEDLNHILNVRREKIDKLRELGINPFPYKFEKTIHIPDLLKGFESKKENEEHIGPEFSIAGRIQTIVAALRFRISLRNRESSGGALAGFERA